MAYAFVFAQPDTLLLANPAGSSRTRMLNATAKRAGTNGRINNSSASSFSDVLTVPLGTIYGSQNLRLLVSADTIMHGALSTDSLPNYIANHSGKSSDGSLHSPT